MINVRPLKERESLMTLLNNFFDRHNQYEDEY